MPMYTVTITEVANYELQVEADSKEDAEWLAEEQFLNSDDPNQWFDSVSEREVDAVEEG